MDALIGRGNARIRLLQLDEALADARTAEALAEKQEKLKGRQLYYLARLYALASIQLELKPRTGKAGQDQAVVQRLALCKDKALDYLRPGSGKTTLKEQAAFSA